MRPEYKEQVLNLVIKRITEAKIHAASNSEISLETIINDTIYHERNRLKDEKKNRQVTQAKQYWKRVNKQLIHASEKEKEKLLTEIATLFADEIVGTCQ